jgi:hypothetical protein
MSCCGRPRPAAGSYQPIPHPGPPSAEPRLRAETAAFVYTGPTRLQADGPVTRRRYRFEHPGAVVDVDGRDAPSFAAIPNLRLQRQSAGGT